MTDSTRIRVFLGLLWIGLIGVGWGIAAASPASAENGVELAPPGPCAEPRVTAVGIAPSDFSVVGPLENLLSPVDVAAASPANAVQAPPASRNAVRPGACEGPGTNCGFNSLPIRDSRPAGIPPASSGGGRGGNEAGIPPAGAGGPRSPGVPPVGAGPRSAPGAPTPVP